MIKDLEEAIYKNYSTIHFSSTHPDAQKEYKNHALYFDKNYSKHLPQDKEAIVVDLACGMGHFLYFLKDKGYKNYLGVDLSDECVKFCKEGDLNIIQANLIDWLKTNKVDCIVANDILEHMTREQTNEFLHYAHKALNPNGSLIIKVPNAANPITGASLRYIDYTHKTSFTELSLKAILRVYFKNNIIFGQNLFVFYKNPLNYIGILGQWVMDNVFYAISYLYGQGELKIFKKSIISVSHNKE